MTTPLIAPRSITRKLFRDLVLVSSGTGLNWGRLNFYDRHRPLRSQLKPDPDLALIQKKI